MSLTPVLLSNEHFSKQLSITTSHRYNTGGRKLIEKDQRMVCGETNKIMKKLFIEL